ncbi:Riboflavin transporter MCH5 [Leucoagaricus sp. SymC.cos]|nr:Riboflavin transporter MCH5 [Leucoagaricus sp. SymC.cos]
MDKRSIDTVTLDRHPSDYKDVEKAPRSSDVDETYSDKVASSTTSDTSTIPDGGIRAWSVVLGAFLTQFCTSGYICSFGVFQDYYTRVYLTAYSASAISWIGSIDTFLILAMGLIGGRLYDRGYVMSLLYGGAFLIALSLFILSLAKPNQYAVVLVCQGVGVGLGGGMMYVPSFAIISQYFNKKRATVLPFVATGVSLGATLTPIMMNDLLQKRNLSFATATRINAGFMTALLITACVSIKPRLPSPKRHARLITCFTKFAKDKAFVILTTGFTFFGLGLFFPIFFLQLAATTHGLDRDFAFNSLVILNGCSCVGRLLSAFLAHKTRVDFMAIGSAIVCGAIIFAFIGIGSAVSVVLVGVIYGFSFGILVATMAPLINMLTDSPIELGLRLGIAYAWTGVGELVGPPIMGALLSGYHWWQPTIFSGLCLLAAAACFAVVSIITRGRQAT